MRGGVCVRNGRTRTAVAASLLLIAAGCGPKVTPVAEVSVSPDAAAESAVAEFVPADGDWPGWRGPDSTGMARSAAAPTSWPAGDGQVIWSAAVPGRGHSSPMVCGDLVVLATAWEETQQLGLVAFDRTTGSQRWEAILHAGGFPANRDMHPKSTHANGTVACDDQRLFIGFLHDDAITAYAVDFEGNKLWEREIGPFRSKFGYAPSPVVYQSTVIFAADNMGGGYLAALDRASGEIVWRKQRPAVSTYSSPVVAKVGGRDQLLISGCDLVSSFDPATGEPLWSCPGTAEATCGTMVWNDSLVFAAGGYPDRQVIAVAADGSGQEVWSNNTKVYEPSMVVVGDQLFAVNDEGVAFCWDAATGERRWQQRLGGSFSASPVVCNGLIYAINDRAELFVFRASPDKYELVAHNQLGDDAYATPSICDGRIYLRVGENSKGRQEMLYCIGAKTDE